MANQKWMGVSANTPGRLVLDAGAIYRNYGEAGEELVGATRGGSTFNVDREDREIEVDGTFGPTKGLRRVIRYTANLEITFVEISQQLFVDLTRGSATSDGTHRTITPDKDILDSDYYTNIAWVGEIKDEATEMVIKLKNAIATNEWDISTDDDDEGEVSATFEAHYDPSNLESVPFEIMIPVSAS